MNKSDKESVITQVRKLLEDAQNKIDSPKKTDEDNKSYFQGKVDALLQVINMVRGT